MVTVASLLLAALLAGATPAPSAPRCVPGTLADLEAIVRHTGRTRVVFFATWCAPCRAHVRAADANTVLVGAFDDLDRLNRALEQVDPLVPCVAERGIAAALGVKGVPALMERTENGWERLERE